MGSRTFSRSAKKKQGNNYTCCETPGVMWREECGALHSGRCSPRHMEHQEETLKVSAELQVQSYCIQQAGSWFSRRTGGPQLQGCVCSNCERAHTQRHTQAHTILNNIDPAHFFGCVGVLSAARMNPLVSPQSSL